MSGADDRGSESDLAARVRAFRDAVLADADLDELALTMSQALQPELDVVSSLADLDELAAECPTPTRDALMTWLFGSGRFVGDRDDYHGWRNSCLDQVLARRRGMPITLSVVAVEVARRVGVTLVGVGMPGHFLVGDPADPGWFADPFHGRTAMTPADCRELYDGMGGGHWSASMLAPTPNRLVVARMLNNLRAACQRSGDAVRLAIVMQLRQQLPEFAAEASAADAAATIFN
jgi:regulator of sirC expression with transglutaminase-like and TPR domain